MAESFGGGVAEGIASGTAATSSIIGSAQKYRAEAAEKRKGAKKQSDAAPVGGASMATGYPGSNPWSKYRRPDIWDVNK